MPQNIYDNPAFFQNYAQLLRSQQGLAGAPEWDTLRRMLPPMPGLRVLDLGCGFGYFSRWVREAGAQSVVALDLSQNMLDRARALTSDSRILYGRAEMEQLGLADAAFDLVFSSLAFHYVPDWNALCETLRRVLVPGGALVFSIEHPIYTAPTQPGWHTNADGSKSWLVNQYLVAGKRVTEWLAPDVVKYHRPLSAYLNPLIEHGFQIVRLDEWQPDTAQLAEHPDWAAELDRPTFLLVSARRTP